MNNLTNKSDDELRDVFESSSQMLASLVHSLGNRPDMQEAIRSLMSRDDMLETFAELPVRESDSMRSISQASVAASASDLGAIENARLNAKFDPFDTL